MSKSVNLVINIVFMVGVIVGLIAGITIYKIHTCASHQDMVSEQDIIDGAVRAAQ